MDKERVLKYAKAVLEDCERLQKDNMGFSDYSDIAEGMGDCMEDIVEFLEQLSSPEEIKETLVHEAIEGRIPLDMNQLDVNLLK